MPRPLSAQPAAPQPPIQRAVLQQPPMGYDQTPTLLIPLEPPGRERLLQLKSEAGLFESWRIEAKQKTGERITFPEAPVLSREPYRGRSWPERTMTAEPYYVNYERLFFEELNAERYGWDLGFFGAAVSSGYFFKDVALFPYHVFTDPCRRFDSSAGYCLPGDPVPYRLYPEGLSATGAIAEAGTIVALFAIFQ
jgi:hypothetical protein